MIDLLGFFHLSHIVSPSCTDKSALFTTTGQFWIMLGRGRGRQKPKRRVFCLETSLNKVVSVHHTYQ